MSGTPKRPFMAERQMAERAARMRGIDLQAEQTDARAAPGGAAMDNSAVLEAIGQLGAKLDRFLAHDHAQIEGLQVEISEIAGRIKAAKVEMAALRHPLSNEDRFHEASAQLNEVVRSTEQATNTILAAVERMETIVGEVRAQLPPGADTGRLDELGDLAIRILEACNFQDLTGQRIAKVVQALSFIEERVDAMMSLWNRREFETLPLPPDLHKKDEGLALLGPAKANESISQADIDALFG